MATGSAGSAAFLEGAWLQAGPGEGLSLRGMQQQGGLAAGISPPPEEYVSRPRVGSFTMGDSCELGW